MEKPAHLEDYLAYVETNKGITALKQFRCGAARDKRPALHNLMPFGDCFLYPGFLVFLTASKSGAGWGTLFTNLVESSTADLALIRWAHDPKEILFDVAKSVNAFLKPEEVDQRLPNSNSIFVPFNIIRRVEAARDWTQGNHITIVTSEGSIILAENLADMPNPIGDLLSGRKPRFVTPSYLFNKMRNHIVGEWHPDVVQALSAAAQ
jgi:hypothetical protein